MAPVATPASSSGQELPKSKTISISPLPADLPREAPLEWSPVSYSPLVGNNPNQCPVVVSVLDRNLLKIPLEPPFPLFEFEAAGERDDLRTQAEVDPGLPGAKQKPKAFDFGREDEGPFDSYPSNDVQASITQYHEIDTSGESLALAVSPPETNSELKPETGTSRQAFSAFPLIFNEKVGDFVNYFQNKGDGFFSRGLARSHAYADMMKKILREKNLPEELFYLALIESGYNPKALSRARASGIWQFMAQTARHFGLTVNKWVDERRDPEKSTYAAAEYLKNLYALFNCWDLAAAGYNAGETKVMRAMKKAKSQDFWEISRHRYLKRETKRYVPMFHAAVMIAKDPQKYGFSNIAYHPPLLYDKVTVPPGTSLAKIAKAVETDLSTIHELNPAITMGKTPPNTPHFEVRIPKGKKNGFEKNFYSAAASNGRFHKVKSGETLSLIAKKYKIDIEELCQCNSLSPKSRIKTGMNLVLPQ